MADYYIDTAEGPRGPYPPDKIIAGVQAGKIPTGARIRNVATNEVCRAVDLTQTQDSSPSQPGYHQQPAPRQAGYYQQPPYQQPQYQQPQYPAQGGHPQPYPQQQYGQPNYNPYGQQYQYYAPAQTSTLAIVSLILSCVSILVCNLLAIGGIVCGVLALKECEPHGNKKGRGLALGGIWVGVGALALTVGVLALFFASGSF